MPTLITCRSRVFLNCFHCTVSDQRGSYQQKQGGYNRALLDDLDKELNNYIMRCREWYGWHFPEVGKIFTDNLAYCKSVRKIGARTNVATTDLSEHLPEEVEAEVKLAAEISMGFVSRSG
uniref:nucleolar protein 58-like n=1 Tax=Oncorhynchus gorbuscha TaxID=8017 RepID=UPI001EAF0020|nr:nucleolar protein 58-like [Oncorhynchus gorbuscha]